MLDLLPSPTISGRGHGASRAHTGCVRQGSRAWHAPVARARFVRQPLQALLQKPLHPFIDKAAADPHGGGDVGQRYAIGHEYDNPGSAGTSRRDGGGALPRQKRLAVRRREANRESSFASTSHIDTSLGGDYGSLRHVLERNPA